MKLQLVNKNIRNNTNSVQITRSCPYDKSKICVKTQTGTKFFISCLIFYIDKNLIMYFKMFKKQLISD